MPTITERIAAAKAANNGSITTARRRFKRWLQEWLAAELPMSTRVRRNANNDDDVMIIVVNGIELLFALHDAKVWAGHDAIRALRLPPTSKNSDGWPAYEVACTEANLNVLDETLISHIARA